MMPSVRPTEVIAREDLSGKLHEIMTLMTSNEAGAWGQIALIGHEIASIGSVVENSIHHRHHRHGVPV